MELVLTSFCSAEEDILKRCLPAFVLWGVPRTWCQHCINMKQLRDQDQDLVCSENTFVLPFTSVAISSPDQLGKEGKCGISQNKAVLACYKSRQLCEAREITFSQCICNLGLSHCKAAQAMLCGQCLSTQKSCFLAW